MNFVDEVALAVVAGRGGSGAVHFRREKFVPKGGPDGGDGGDGGDVVVQATASLQTMADLAGLSRIAAENGRAGGPQRRSGHSGQTATIRVPLGVVVYDDESGEQLADLTADNQSAVVAAGGRGGRGNWHFRSATNQTPEEFEPGTEGASRRIRLELRLLADVGFIGLPNAGKSSLLNCLAGTKARVGAYPFTTINPNLGVLRRKGRDLILADIPGLVAGAAAGKGLGHQFLQHSQRCRVLVHCLAADSRNLLADYETVRAELHQYDPALMDKPEIIVLTKADLLSLDDQRAASATMEPAGKKAIILSAYTGKGLDNLISALNDQF